MKAMLLHCRWEGDACTCTTPDGTKIKLPISGAIMCGGEMRGDDDVDEIVSDVLARIAAERK